jgi:hypothetical protein
MICAVCRREGRGFGFHPAFIRRPGRPSAACSMTCLHIIAERKRAMIDPTPNEQAAIRHGGDMGGEVLDSLGRTDLALLTETEWLAFVEAIVTGYCDRLRDLAGRDRRSLKGMEANMPF